MDIDMPGCRSGLSFLGSLLVIIYIFVLLDSQEGINIIFFNMTPTRKHILDFIGFRALVSLGLWPES